MRERTLIRPGMVAASALGLAACAQILGLGSDYQLSASSGDSGGRGGVKSGGATSTGGRASGGASGRDGAAGGGLGESGEGGVAGEHGGSPNEGGTAGVGGSRSGAGGTVSVAGKAGSASSSGGGGGVVGSHGGTAGAAAGTGGTSGGSVATGGIGGTSGGAGVGAGGTSAGTGGSSMAGAAGSSSGVRCDPTWSVSNDGFVRMPAKNGACWSGYAFAGGDSTSTVMFPGGGKDFSMSMGRLEISGTVGSATGQNMYAGNVFFGFNVGQVVGSSTVGTITPTGTSLTITCTGCATPMMRAELFDNSTTWCANLTSGTAIPYSSFTQECYSIPPGAAYAKQPISAIEIEIPGASMAATYDLTVLSVTEQ